MQLNFSCFKTENAAFGLVGQPCAAITVCFHVSLLIVHVTFLVVGNKFHILEQPPGVLKNNHVNDSVTNGKGHVCLEFQKAILSPQKGSWGTLKNVKM